MIPSRIGGRREEDPTAIMAVSVKRPTRKFRPGIPDRIGGSSMSEDEGMEEEEIGHAIDPEDAFTDAVEELVSLLGGSRMVVPKVKEALRGAIMACADAEEMKECG